MKFRPCIDIHNGRVKQIVGSTLLGENAAENFVSDLGAAHFAKMYRRDGLTGGHVILLNAKGTEFYEADKEQAFEAFREYPGGLQVGGGIDDENAAEFLSAGASHVIVTSFVFKGGALDTEALGRLIKKVGKEHIVLDLSCKKFGGEYFVMTDRWSVKSDMALSERTVQGLSASCAELLVHAVDAEGKSRGIDGDLVKILAASDVPVTYAGGISSYSDIERLGELGGGKVDFTVGSALDIFGGKMEYEVLARSYAARG